MARPATIYWFRRDLRLADNRGLTAAADRGPLVPLYIDDRSLQPSIGGAGRWWLHHSLNALSAALEAAGSRLIVRSGAAREILLDLAKAMGADAVYCERSVEPETVVADARLQSEMGRVGIRLVGFDGALLTSPERVRSGQGKPFKVFTPFWREARAAVSDARPLPIPRAVSAPATWPESIPVDSLALLPSVDWAGGLKDAWQPGEAGATALLASFTGDRLRNYPEARDFPDQRGTSRLSPHLHFGEISVRSVWSAVEHEARRVGEHGRAPMDAYLRQLGWREFAHHVLFHFPHTVNEPLDATMRGFDWTADRDGYRRWCRGQTGFPIVDAGMRELWHTGWMHNRVRMIVASFLVKDLLCDWRLGATWFLDTLVDADLANNTLGWQWAAGCGADAAPYFRIFNPVVQGRKFDRSGTYVRRWVPELARLDDEWIHAPWTAPALALDEARIALGRDYPHPAVDHAVARTRALAVFAARRSGSKRDREQ